MLSNRSGGMRIVLVALAACLSAAACSQTTPPGTALITPSATAKATATPKPTPTATPTVEITAEASPSVAPSATPLATLPAAEAVPATTCTGSADNQAFFEETAKKQKFDVYCAVLSPKWWLDSGSYTLPGGGSVLVEYKNSSGAVLSIAEGNFCVSSCSPKVSTLGSAAFGDRVGELDLISSSPETYAIYVDPGTKLAYQITGYGMTQATFISLAAGLVKVARS
jgi:hypothetical protein